MVNTFVLTARSLAENALMLDWRRLGKQRVEAFQIIQTLSGQSKGWRNHPATLMWKNHINALKLYFNSVVKEWVRRGYKNNMVLFDVVDEEKYFIRECTFDGNTAQFSGTDDDPFAFPKWFSFPPFILAHQASLYRKDPEHYHFFEMAQLQPYIYSGYLWPHKWSESELYSNWKDSYLDSFGTGVPPQYRISKETVLEWLKHNKEINPLSNKKISANGPMWRQLEAAREAHGL